MSIRVVTWNMQGGGPGASKWISDVSRLFTQADADIACLQACGPVPAQAVVVPPPSSQQATPSDYVVFKWNVGGSKNKLEVAIVWLKTRRGNLAIVTRVPFVATVVPLFDSGLLALGIILQVGGGPLTIYTSNEFFSSDPDDPVLLDEIDKKTGNAAWFAAGDFNQEPTDWLYSQDSMPEGATCCPHDPVMIFPGAGTNMDYAFISPAVSTQGGFGSQSQGSGATAPSVKGVVDSRLVSADHFPVFYDLPFDMGSQ
jgi:endonuclease/exonuclease/phosphatase family metal-dependent hydrolase